MGEKRVSGVRTTDGCLLADLEILLVLALTEGLSLEFEDETTTS